MNEMYFDMFVIMIIILSGYKVFVAFKTGKATKRSLEIFEKKTEECRQIVSELREQEKTMHNLLESRKLEELAEEYNRYAENYRVYEKKHSSMHQAYCNSRFEMENKRKVHNLYLGGASDISSLGYYRREEEYIQIANRMPSYTPDVLLLTRIQATRADVDKPWNPTYNEIT